MDFSALQLEWPEYGIYRQRKPGSSFSPSLSRALAGKPLPSRLPDALFGPSPPSVFVGREGYPRVNVGPMVSLVPDAPLLDNPAEWFGASLEQIVAMRTSLVLGRQKHAVKGDSSRMVEDVQLTAMSRGSVDMEMAFSRAPRVSLAFAGGEQPMGPAGEIKKLTLADNPSVPKKIDSVVAEKLKVREALPELAPRFDYYYLQKVLSAGVLGADRKLVPTRRSITAMDRMLADYYLQTVKESPPLSEFRVYSSTYLYNHFEVLLMPGVFEYEQFESWEPSSYSTQAPSIEHEYEPFEGRSDYAESEGGGYYAGRFAAAEALKKLGRQARVVVFREIGREYSVPVGVWEVRENVRHAFLNAFQKFSTLNEALSHLQNRLKHPLSAYRSLSQVLTQKRLSDYL